jgi:hypothetical protein
MVRKIAVEDGYTFRIVAWNLESAQPTVKATCYEGEHPDLGFITRLFNSSTSATVERVGLESTIKRAKAEARAKMKRKDQAHKFFDS